MADKPVTTTQTQQYYIPRFPKVLTESTGEYAAAINDALKDLGYPNIEYVGDKKGGEPNVPEVGEVRVTVDKQTVSSFLSKGKDSIRAWNDLKQATRSTITPSSFTPSVKTALEKARAMYEKRRLAVMKSLFDQITVVPSRTREIAAKQNNPAENAWLENVSAPLAKDVAMIMGRQEDARFPELLKWMQQNGDEYSRRHFYRTLSLDLPKLKDPSLVPADIKNPALYASEFPWMPKKRSISGMYSQDMSQELIDHINGTFPADHVARLPWTVVEIISAKEAKKYPAPLTNELGIETHRVEKVVMKDKKTGKDRTYNILITNISYHPDFRPYIVNKEKTGIADILRANMHIEREGSRLDPEFRAHILVVADGWEYGDFLGMLKSDLNQTKGNLYLSIFPHEGYGNDNKYPVSMVVGVRDPGFSSISSGQDMMLGKVEDWLCANIRKGNSNYTCRTPKQSDIEKGTQLVWVWRSAGFMRGFVPGQVGGHDYPKSDLPGITGHRSVVFSSVIDAITPFYKAVAEDVLQSEDAAIFSAGVFTYNAALHETVHYGGMRRESQTNTGRTMQEVFGKTYWGLIAEGLADGTIGKAISFIGENPANEDHDMAREVAVSAATYSAYWLLPKEKALNPGYIDQAPHLVAQTMMVGFHALHGGLKMGPDGRFLRLDPAQFFKVRKDFATRLAYLSGRDELSEIEKLLNETIYAVPSTVTARLIEVQKRRKPLMGLVDHKDLCQLCDEK